MSLRCDWLDWHKPTPITWWDGASRGSLCLRCGRTILQDSQGNWFAIEKDRSTNGPS